MYMEYNISITLAVAYFLISASSADCTNLIERQGIKLSNPDWCSYYPTCWFPMKRERAERNPFFIIIFFFWGGGGLKKNNLDEKD